MRIVRGKPRQERIITGGGESFLARRFRPDYFTYGWHAHPEIELTLIVKGRGTRAVGDSIELYRTGDLVLLGSHTPHSWKSDPADGSVESIVIQFLPGVVESKLPEFRVIGKLLESAKRGLFVPPGSVQREVMQQMKAIIDAPPGSARRAMLLFDALVCLSEAADLRPLSATVFAASKNEKNESILQRVLELIQDDEAELSQAEIAEQFDMSPQGFSRFFKTQLGKPFVAYVNEWRVGNACRLLAETKDDVTSIAFKSGFNNLSNFNRRFLQIKGMTPRDYRARIGELESAE